MDYFTLLNLTPAFDLDLTELEKAYFAAQRQYHPDRFVSKPTAERQVAMQRSVDINQAYQTLKQPLARARYLLKQQGILVGTDHDTIKPSQELLIEAMDWREEGQSPGELAALREESLHHIALHYKQQNWQEMAEETLRLGYIVKTLDDAS